jgi:hypothetical protein
VSRGLSDGGGLLVQVLREQLEILVELGQEERIRVVGEIQRVYLK